MMGLTATGKSTVAKLMASEFDAEIYHSALIRKELGYKFSLEEAESNFFTYENNNRSKMDKKVYDTMLAASLVSFRNKKNVVLDAGHFFYCQRKNIYNKSNKSNLDVIIIKTVSSESIVKKRLKKRVDNFENNPLNETPSFLAYQSAKKIIEDPSRDEIENEISNLFIYNTNTGVTENVYNKDLNNNSILVYHSLNNFKPK